jgi:uncharacterized protein DUF3311
VYARNVIAESGKQRRRWALWLFLLPVAAIVYPPLYNREHPTLIGIPFFVWYQLCAVVFGGAVTGLVYLLRHERHLER